MSDFYIVMQFIIDSIQFALIWCLFAKLKESSNKIVNDRIEKLKGEIRSLKASGIKQQALSPIYAKITQLEIRLL